MSRTHHGWMGSHGFTVNAFEDASYRAPCPPTGGRVVHKRPEGYEGEDAYELSPKGNTVRGNEVLWMSAPNRRRPGANQTPNRAGEQG